MRARPIATIWRSPPDRRPAGVRRRGTSAGNSESTRARISAIASRSRLRRVRAPTCRFSSTVSPGNTRPPSITWATPRRTMPAAAASQALVEVPSTPPSSSTEPPTIVPRWKPRSPETARSRVVLPAPLAPTTATTDPDSTSIVTPCRAGAPP